jgi:crotonobetainyl-CoA:carnitine CoA-transferase CaiB-like acyl-CoA transferase
VLTGGGTACHHERNRNWKRYRHDTPLRDERPRCVEAMPTDPEPTTPSRTAHEGVSPGSTAPLAGVRIVAVEQYGAGPFGTLYLADLGAEVIKIEDPSVGGDVSRYIPPGRVGTDSLFFEAFNRGKRSLALDLKTPSGRVVFERLVATADAVFSNLRGDQAERLGLTYDTLARINPRIVCVALTGYGRDGPGARLPGYDALIQAEAGWASLTGTPDGPPTKSGLSLADYICGLTAALGLVVALLDARRTGLGRDVDTNLYDSALAMLSYPATWFLSSGFVTERYEMSAHPSVVPFQFFATADGHVAVANPKEKFFRALVKGMDLPDLAGDARFADFEARGRHRAELLAILSARFAERTTVDWLGRLRGIVPIAPVRSLQQALDVDELRDRSMLAEYDHPSFGTVRSVGLPLTMGGFEPTYSAGPSLGEDSDEIMRELGFDAAAVDALRSGGAFGSGAAPVAEGVEPG